MKLTLYYSVEDGGDGSAYPRWFETEELAEWHQNHLDDGWGEPCTGDITVEGNNLICTELRSKEGYYLELLLGGYEDENQSKEREEFKAEFFPDGPPEFTVKISRTNYYGVYVEGKLAYEQFAYPEKKANEKGAKKLQTKLDKLAGK